MVITAQENGKEKRKNQTNDRFLAERHVLISLSGEVPPAFFVIYNFINGTLPSGLS